MRHKKKPQSPRQHRREAVKILAAATRGAIDRYFELFMDELDRVHQSLQQAERWAEHGGKLPHAVVRHQELAKLAYDTPWSCHFCGRCAQCKAERELSTPSLGFDFPVSELFDFMLRDDTDLDGALAQLESTMLGLTGNGILTGVVIAHALARAGYSPSSVAKRCGAPGLRVIEGGRGRWDAGALPG